MSKISIACWDYDRAIPVLDGTVPVAGFETESVVAPPGTLFPLAVGDAPYDVTELSFASYLIQRSRGESAYIGIPIYVSRAFRHGAIYVRTDRGIETPQDLDGKTVGVPEYGMTMAVWLRGLLADEYGVDVASLSYRTAGLNKPGRVERLKLGLPDHIRLEPLKTTETLNDALIDGRLDAVLAPSPPACLADGSAPVRRLIEPAGPAERDYYKRTGIFPIMHILGVRRTLAEAHPGLCQALFNAFAEARLIALGRVRDVAEGSANRVMSPWFAEAYDDAVSAMGHDYWTYGIDGNEAALGAFCRYLKEQHLTDRRLSIEEVFADIS